MSLFQVSVKHSGKTHSIALDASQPPRLFKDAIYHSTGVPTDRMKVMIKGGTLKDEDWGKLAIKEGMSFMVIGAAGELPKPPEKQTVFLEDMDDQELAEALALPVGLKNLGNTCYMNATIQAMRSIPELQTSLSSASSSGGIHPSLNQLYTAMSRTTDVYVPLQFLAALRQAFPQFSELSRSGGKAMQSFAQQDAEECYSQILGSLKDLPAAGNPGKKLVESWMMGRVRRELRCDEAPEEEPTISTENVLKIECNISIQTNYMESGIKDSLDQSVSKRSPTLNREASYTQRSRLERLPTYLTVHMVRFAWRRDIGKKAKIMRKVKFPTEYNAIDLVTSDLKAKLQPLQEKFIEVENRRAERRKIRRHKVTTTTTVTKPSDPADMETEPNDPNEVTEKVPLPEELEDESKYRERELAELEALVNPDIKEDAGASATGLYELVAIITHKGAAADAGHYIGFVKKNVFHPREYENNKDGRKGALDENDEGWYKFDDEKVSEFPVEKLTTLDGGGEDASAYVLIYKTRPLA